MFLFMWVYSVGVLLGFFYTYVLNILSQKFSKTDIALSKIDIALSIDIILTLL